MTSFFTSSDKIKVGQTQVSVPAENGLNYKPGGRIDMFIPPTSKFVDLSQTKLKFDVKLTGVGTSASANLMRLQLDAQTGAHSLIRSVRVFSGRKTALLEEIEGYDVLTALRFDYETNENFKAKRAITDGATNYDPACRGNQGTLKTIQANVVSNPYFKKYGTVDDANPAAVTYDTDPFNTVKCELQLNTGLFRNEAVFPALLTDGIFLEILLQDKNRVFRSLDSTAYNRQIKLNPEFHSIDGVDSTSLTSGSLTEGDTTSVLFLTRNNNMTSIQTCPFIVGERIQMATMYPEATVTPVRAAGEVFKDVWAAPGIISNIEYVTPAASTPKLKITLESAITQDSSSHVNASINPVSWIYSAAGATGGDVVTTAADYLVSNVEMVVEQIQVPQGYEQSMINMMKEGGTINYDYRSFTNYRYSQLKGDNFANIRLPLIESRATSILCIPTDAKNYSILETITASGTYITNVPDTVANEVHYQRSCRPAITGVTDNLQAYQLIYDGKLNPSRRVDISKISARDSISQQWLIEAEKALAMSDIEPLSFLAFQDNFFIGRALALGKNAVYDARGRDFNLQVEYTGAAQGYDKLWQCFCSHIRRLEIKNGGVAVQV
tara:strand:- start:6601 stop:8427 length:1827 start_codon:yes stop_codon:yes gene_type:complete